LVYNTFKEISYVPLEIEEEKKSGFEEDEEYKHFQTETARHFSGCVELQETVRMHGRFES